MYHINMSEQEYFYDIYPLGDIFTIENDLQIVYLVNPDDVHPGFDVNIVFLSLVDIPKNHRLPILKEIRQI